jgi:hypothetical protein
MINAGVHCRRMAFAGAMTVSCVVGWHTSAFGGSDNSSDTYAGDVNGLALPEGTVLAIEYLGYRHSDQYITTPSNIFAKLGGAHAIDSTGEIYTEISRLSYFSRLMGQPLVIEAAFTDVNIKDVNIGNLPAPIGGFGPQTIAHGFIDPVIFVTYGLIADPRGERFLGLTNYIYLPGGGYDNFKQVNATLPHQYTWVPQLAYAEGLGKFAPGLRNFWFDLIVNASLHSSGESPLALAPGVQFDRMTQGNSYDLKAFLRYDYMQGGHVALGIEKSWGGNQVASGGLLQTIFGGPTSLGMDDFLKGHVQASYAITKDFHVSADVTHDFEREGGLKEDVTAEIRFTKFFLPQAQAQAQPLK